MSRIDAHQHFWKPERGNYSWLTEDLEPLYRDFLPEHLLPLLEGAGLSGSILIQAAATEAETDFMLTLANAHAFIKGVVGWTDLDSPNAPERIGTMSAHHKLVGLRPMIQDIAEDDWMLRPNVSAALSAMAKQGLTFDALTLPRHLKVLRQLAEKHPDLTVIIDHGSKPEIRNGAFSGWADDMRRLADETSAWCKLSGLVTEASQAWRVEDLKPYVDHLLTSFGPQRLIWGSDWPVCTLAASYDDWVSATDQLLADLGPSDRQRIWGENALEAYGLT